MTRTISDKSNRRASRASHTALLSTLLVAGASMALFVIHAQQPAGDEYGFTFDELPPEEPVAQPGMAAPQLPVAGAGDITHVQSLAELDDYASTPAGHSESPVQDDEDTREHPVPAFSDDPVDTKLDLARAYLDMGDPDGARAMLEEVLHEGSQTQRDVAKRMLDDLH